VVGVLERSSRMHVGVDTRTIRHTRVFKGGAGRARGWVGGQAGRRAGGQVRDRDRVSRGGGEDGAVSNRVVG
jgi:hypothetical protein